MGWVDHGQDALAYNIAYGAARRGSRTLFITMGTPFEDSLTRIAVMHSHDPVLFQGAGLSLRKLQNGLLSEVERRFLHEGLLPSMVTDLKNLVIRTAREDQRWSAVRRMIEAEQAKQPLDLVVIDSVDEFDLAGGRLDPIMRALRDMSRAPESGHGMSIVSPVRGTRTGYEDAQRDNGRWDPTDIYQILNFADTIVYTFRPEELKGMNKIKIGLAKNNRCAPVDPQIVDLNPDVGLVGCRNNVDPFFTTDEVNPWADPRVPRTQ